MPRRRRRREAFFDFDPDEELDFETDSSEDWLDEEWSADEDDDEDNLHAWRRKLREDQGFDPEEVL